MQFRNNTLHMIRLMLFPGVKLALGFQKMFWLRLMKDCCQVVRHGVLISAFPGSNPGINLKDKFALFNDYWSPKIIGDLNDSHIKIAKFKGEFTWHKHDNEDELFYVVKGSLLIKLRDEDITLTEGEFVIIPKGVEHFPIAEEEVHVMLIEPKSTLNTGDARRGDLTVEDLDKL